jgi:hypothetical protein
MLPRGFGFALPTQSLRYIFQNAQRTESHRESQLGRELFLFPAVRPNSASPQSPALVRLASAGQNRGTIEEHRGAELALNHPDWY